MQACELENGQPVCGRLLVWTERFLSGWGRWDGGSNRCVVARREGGPARKG
jgi:hypothetical protein